MGDETQLSRFKNKQRTQQRYLRLIMRIRWFHCVSNIEVLSRAKCLPTEVLTSRSRLPWVGYIQRMQGNRLEKCILYRELCQGSRSGKINVWGTKTFYVGPWILLWDGKSLLRIGTSGEGQLPVVLLNSNTAGTTTVLVALRALSATV